MTSLELSSGRIIRQERVGAPDAYHASPVAGDGKLYLASQSGVLSVLRAEANWELLSAHTLEDADVWATPAIAGRAVYVRSKETVFCFQDHER